MNLILMAIICSVSTKVTLGFGLSSTTSCSTSPLFITRQSITQKKMARIPNRIMESCVVLSMTDEAKNAEIIGKTPHSANSVDERSLFQKIDDYGLKLKPMAEAANGKAQSVTDNRTQKILYTAKSCLLYSAFILYRGYRGFFVILPAVFQQVYRKMDMVLNDPFYDESKDSSVDVQPKRKVPLRTAVVVSFVSLLVTLSYAVTGAYKVLAKFIGTATRTSAVEPAFQAAADEILTNEGKILKMTNENQIVNGEELAP